MLGIIKNLSNEEYHAHKDSISRSAIMDYLDSPYKYWAKHVSPLRQQKIQTHQMMFGEAFHTLILEPTEFEKRFIVEPVMHKSPVRVLLKNVGPEKFNAYKNSKAAIDALNDALTEEFDNKLMDKKILTVSEFMKLKEMKSALMAHPQAWDLIEGALYETSYFWNDTESGLTVKARPDILHQNMIIDLKTIANASPRSFQNSMILGGYHIQGAMIRDAVRNLEQRDIPNVINIAIEKEYPYSIGIYIIDECALDHGQEKYKQTLLDIKCAREYNNYPDYEVQTISLPRWAL